MEMLINSVSAETVMKCKKGSQEAVQHMRLINPQMYGNEILFDVHVTLPDNFSITCKHEGKCDKLIIQLSNLGDIELDTKDFRDVYLM